MRKYYLNYYSVICLDALDMIRTLCGVEHDDLKRLFFVSKSIREATLIAKRWHFADSTPKKTLGFPNAIDFENVDELMIEQAPRQVRIPRARLSSKKLADISVTLYTSAGEQNWLRRELFVAMDAEI
ncbi:F-box protein SKIP27-like [Coffea arabica]|uniref:F-box protein SKIP27-like n=1 Tax=Coffea arabica TaxID=13443 RepID=A0ABM4V3I1_COFAR